MSPPAPEIDRFSVLDACSQGLRLLADNARVLAAAAIVPFAVTLVTGFIVAYAASMAAGPLRLFLYSLPAHIGMGWMIFISVRLWLLKEMPGQPGDLSPSARMAALQATIITYILWKALMAIYEQTFITLIDPAALAADPESSLSLPPGAQAGLLAMLALLFWAVRFRLAPVLTAVGYPLRRYVAGAHGILLSVRLLALIFLCVELPRALLLVGMTGTGSAKAIVIVNFASAFVFELWLFAAFTVALRQMLRQRTP